MLSVFVDPGRRARRQHAMNDLGLAHGARCAGASDAASENAIEILFLMRETADALTLVREGTCRADEI
jgi:hypothetical protein